MIAPLSLYDPIRSDEATPTFMQLVPKTEGHAISAGSGMVLLRAVVDHR
jgi:hypothetical protein